MDDIVIMDTTTENGNGDQSQNNINLKRKHQLEGEAAEGGDQSRKRAKLHPPDTTDHDDIQIIE